jgi:hypothetical protein
MVIREGEPGDKFFVIVRGKLSVRTILSSLCLSLDRKLFSHMLASNPAVRAAIEITARDRLIVSGNKIQDRYSV